MEVVYFFCESGVIRVPFFDYDEKLFRQCVKQGGLWIRERSEFILNPVKNVEALLLNFTGKVCILVKETSQEPVRIVGFLKRSWPEIFSEHWRGKLDDSLRARKYSLRTQRLYLYFNRLLCNVSGKKPEEIESDDITRFLAEVEKNKEYSSSTMNLAISAVKFFYKYVLRLDVFKEQRRPRYDKNLPMILSKSEINKMLDMEKNPKHRLILMLAYSSGLRVSEVVALKLTDIDLDRKLIFVRLGKGRKDRCTLLSEKAARFLCDYCVTFDVKTWLFPGQPITQHLTIRSAQHIFEKAVTNAQIRKKVSIHSLRHTFATHLLESGIDIRYIQNLLGHSSIRTTERYTHVARKNILSIKSPFDSFVE